MKKLRVALVIVLIFGAGFAGGVFVTRAVVHRAVLSVLRNPDRVRAAIEKRLQSKLNLDADQRRKVGEILTKTQSDIKDLRTDFSPRFYGIMSNAQSEISAVLTEPQRERFRKFREENRQFLTPK